MTNTNSAYITKSTYISSPATNKFVTKGDLVEKARFIENYFDTIYEAEFKDQFATKLDCYKECLLAITVVFHHGTIELQQSERSFGRKAEPLSAFKEFHFKILQDLFGKNIGRKKQYQPKLFGFIDFEGTRNGHGSAEKRNPHIHAVALVRPEHRFRYQMELTSHIRWVQSGTIQDIKVEQYDPARGTVENLIGYCIKGLEDLPVNEACWYELQLPPGDMRSKFGPSKLAKMAGRDYRLGLHRHLPRSE